MTMNRFQVVCLLAVFSLILLPVFSPNAAPAAKQMITIGAGAKSSLDYSTSAAIGKFVNRQTRKNGLRVIIKPTDGSTGNLLALEEGTVDFGMVHSDRQYMAWNGTKDWGSLGAQKDLRSICSFHTESLALVAADDARISCLTDLKGKTISIGSFGSCQRINAKDALKAAKVDHQEDIDARSLATDEQSAALMAGKIDAFFVTAGHPSPCVKAAACGKRAIHFVPITGKGIDKLVKKKPYYTKATIPVALYPQVSNTEDVETIAVKTTLCTREQVSEETVYTLTKAIFENLDVLKKMHPVYRGLTAKGMLETLSAPIHPGAMKYYREVGLK